MPKRPGGPPPSDAQVRHLTEEQAQHLAQLYADCERDILNELNRALLKGNQTQYLQSMLGNVQKILADLQSGTRTWCETAVPAIYLDGVKYASQQLAADGYKVIGGFGTVHQQAMQVLAENIYQRLGQVSDIIGRQTQDIYRQLALENIKGSVAGYNTWLQVAKKYREQLATNGVTGFKDRAGRNWNMTTYARMVAVTGTMEAHLAGTANRLMEHGHDLVEVSSHINACKYCQPWQGKVLSLTGKDQNYPSLAEAKEQGLFHPNCGHDYAIALSWGDVLPPGSPPAPPKAPPKPPGTNPKAPPAKVKLPPTPPKPGTPPAPAPAAGKPNPFAAKNIKEAAEFAKANNLADVANYKGAKVEAANEWNAGILDALANFPALRSNLKFIGTIQERDALLFEYRLQDRAQWLKPHYPNLSDEQLLAMAKRSVKRDRVSGNTYAQSWKQQRVGGISINKTWGGDIEKWQEALKNNVTTRWHPEGCDTIKSVVDHELGHQIDDLLDLRNNPEIIKLYHDNAKALASRGPDNPLSRYAATKITEFIAEAYGEFKNNPKPRPIAAKVGEIIMRGVKK